VTVSALEDRVVVRIRVARRAYAIRIAVVHREVSVVPVSRNPGSRVVTRRAGRREARRRMIWVIGAAVIRLMTRVAVRRQRSVIVVDVAARTRNLEVEARQRERRAVVIEGAVGPHRRVMTQLAGGRESGRCMAGIVRAVEVGQVASNAGRIRQLEIVVDVALAAARAGQVEAGQRPPGTRVIESGSIPVAGAVTGRAIRRESGSLVIRIGGCVVIRHMARGTGSTGQAVVAIHMASRAWHRGVEAGQRKAGGGVIPGGTAPRSRVMALLASLREVGLHVIGIGRALKILEMAAYTCRTRQIVVTVNVTLRARHGGVRARQSEAGGRVIKGRVRP